MMPLAKLKATVASPLPPPTTAPLNGFMGSVTRTQAKLFGVIYWRQAQRARAWQPLRKPKLIPLRLLSAGPTQTEINSFAATVSRDIHRPVLGDTRNPQVSIGIHQPDFSQTTLSGAAATFIPRPY